MKVSKHISLIIIGLLLIPSGIKATHIIGGNFHIKHITLNFYEVTMKMYRDCNPNIIANFDPPANVKFGIFDLVTNGKLLNPNNAAGDYFFSTLTRDTLQLGKCGYVPPGLCVEQGTYSVVIQIPYNVNGYYLVWERCCRNALIDNIEYPDTTGMTFYAEMPDPLMGNTSPEFVPYPTEGFFCAGDSLDCIDFSATDIDGDSLVYSLVDPLASANTTMFNALLSNAQPKPYPPINWLPPYSLADIVGGSPPLSIDPQTGFITGSPSLLGVYVFAVKVEEFRFGTKIGEIRSELQYATRFCPANIAPKFELNDTTIQIVAKTDTCFSISATDANTGDTLTLRAFSSILTGDTSAPYATFTDTLSLDTVTSQFCWQTTCADIQGLPYTIQFEVFDDNCLSGCFWGKPDTGYLTVYIQVIAGNNAPGLYYSPPEALTALEPDQNLCLDIIASDVNPSQQISLEGSSELFTTDEGPNASFVNNTGTGGSVSSPFCFETTCDFIREEPYSVLFKAYDSGCAPDTAFLKMDIPVYASIENLISKAPNIFTPNGDEHNSTFRLPSFTNACYDSFRIDIYNRWGSRVFRSDDIHFEWDGISREGQQVLEGIYYYVIKATFNDKVFKKNGYVTVVR